VAQPCFPSAFMTSPKTKKKENKKFYGCRAQNRWATRCLSEGDGIARLRFQGPSNFGSAPAETSRFPAN